MQFSLSRCPLSTKSGVGVYEDRGSSWPQVNPVCLLTLPHTHYTHSSCLIGCKQGWKRPNGPNCPWNGAFLTSSWPSWLSWTLPPSCIVHIMRMIFAFYSISFWPSWHEIWTCRGSKNIIVDSSITVWPAIQNKNFKMVKSLVMGTKKFTFHQFWPKFQGCKVKTIKKWRKVPYFRADLRLGSHFGPILTKVIRGQSTGKICHLAYIWVNCWDINLTF